jgi:hypothetical protein
MTVSDTEYINTMQVVADLQICVNELTKRIKALETVVAGALPDFNNETVKEYSEKKRLSDLIFFRNEILKDAKLSGYCAQDNYSATQELQMTLTIGEKMIFSSILMKKPTLTY